MIAESAQESTSHRLAGKNPASRPAHDGVSVAFFTGSQVIVGVFDPKGLRISDVVNSHTSSYLSLFGAETQDLVLGGDPKPPVAELTLRKDALELVVPQDRQSASRPHVATGPRRNDRSFPRPRGPTPPGQRPLQHGAADVGLQSAVSPAQRRHDRALVAPRDPHDGAHRAGERAIPEHLGALLTALA